MVVDLNYISIRMFVNKAIDWTKHLFTRRWHIVISLLLGMSLGLIITFFSKPSYTGNLTFVLSSESSPAGNLLAIANQFGLSFGNKNNAFDGENIIQLFKSKAIFKRALFKSLPNNQDLIINQIGNDEYFFAKWKKDNRLRAFIPFIVTDVNAKGTKDSLIGEIYKYALTHYLTLDKIEKDLNFYKISITSNDENISNYLPIALVDVTAQFYIEIKQDVAKRNLQMLEKEADSLQSIMNKSLDLSLTKRGQLLNLNSALQSAEAPAKKNEIRTRVLQNVYGNVVENLQIAKVTLQKITPVYQVIDEPQLALYADKPSYTNSMLTGAFLSTFFFVFYLLIRKNVARLGNYRQ